MKSQNCQVCNSSTTWISLTKPKFSSQLTGNTTNLYLSHSLVSVTGKQTQPSPSLPHQTCLPVGRFKPRLTTFTDAFNLPSPSYLYLLIYVSLLPDAYRFSFLTFVISSVYSISEPINVWKFKYMKLVFIFVRFVINISIIQFKLILQFFLNVIACLIYEVGN